MSTLSPKDQLIKKLYLLRENTLASETMIQELKLLVEYINDKDIAKEVFMSLMSVINDQLKGIRHDNDQTLR
jgi:hypothetical protein